MFVDEAIELGDRLLEKAKESESEIFWETQSSDLKDKKYKSTSIYNGCAGFVLFFLELYKVTLNEKYLSVVKKGISWCLRQEEERPEESFAFYTGKMSVVYMLIKAYRDLGDSKYLEKAEEIAFNVRAFIEYPIADLLNGISGTLLVLTHLHSVAKKNWILQEIKIFATELIKRINIAPNGIYWDRSNINITGLCGLSHGASGIAFVFLELGNYFQNKACFWIAEQAIKYESNFFEPAVSNWADLRTLIHIEDQRVNYEKAYENNDVEFFEGKNFVSGWCHGAPGIGLVRLRAFELLGKESFWREAKASVLNVKGSLNNRDLCNNVSVCHGDLGNIELLLYAYQLTSDPSYQDFAFDSARKILKEKAQVGYFLSGMPDRKEDDSLFLGNAGVGYMLLSISRATYSSTESILFPKINSIAEGNLIEEVVSLEKVRSAIITSKFAGTFRVLQEIFPVETNNLLATENENFRLLNSWNQYVTSILERDFEYRQLLQDIYQHERWSLEKDFDTRSNAYVFFREQMLKRDIEKLLAMSEDLFRIQHLELLDGAVLKRLSYNLSFVMDGKFDQALDEASVLLIPRFWGLSEIPIKNQLLSLILDAFSRNREVQSVAIETLQAFHELASDEERIQAIAIVIAQIKEALVFGFLVPTKQIDS